MKGFKIDPLVTPETRQFMKAVLAKLEQFTEPCDVGSLYMLMMSYDMYIKASKMLLQDGPVLTERSGKRTVHPAVGLTKSYWTQVATYMRELGLTLKSRERINAFTPPVDDDNPLVQFLKG